MKKALALLLCIIVMCGVAIAEDYSALSTEDLQTQINLMRNELVKRELVAGEKVLIFDKNGVQIYLTGEYEEKSSGKLRLKTIIINDSKEEVAINPELSVNGWDVGCSGWKTDANAGMKAKGYFDFSISAADISSYSEIEEIVFRYKAKFGSGHWEAVDPVTVYFNAQP